MTMLDGGPAPNRRTTGILCAVAALVALAALVGARPRPAGPAAAAAGSAPPPSRAQIDLGPGTLRAALASGAVLLGGDGTALLVVEIGGHKASGIARPPLNLAIVIDRSGSMAGDKLERARAAARAIVRRLGPADQVALVPYDDRVDVLVPSVAVDAAGRQRLETALRLLAARGGTNLGAGFAYGRDEVLRAAAAPGAPRRLGRVLLLTDGQANIGVTDPAALGEMAAEAASSGIHTTTIGVGLDYNEDLLARLAEGGRGQYYHAEDAADLEQVFAGELRALEDTVATELELRLEPASAGVRIEEVYGQPSRREGEAVFVPLADLSGDERRQVVVRLRVPTGTPGARPLVTSRLAFRDPQTGAPGTAALTTGIEITSDPAAAAASADRQARLAVEQALRAQALREAVLRYEGGDRGGALGLLQKRRSEETRSAAELGVPADRLGPSLAPLERLESAIRAAPPTSAAGRAGVKRAKSSAWDLSRKR